MYGPQSAVVIGVLVFVFVLSAAPVAGASYIAAGSGANFSVAIDSTNSVNTK
ncbi:MAG: hypothetical protein ABEI27_03180 [Halobellus sp.]|uniref:hypothetical protein n=1 Tax=Halobellus sp. TaxID=1979212 RepID=UPI0035D412E5